MNNKSHQVLAVSIILAGTVIGGAFLYSRGGGRTTAGGAGAAPGVKTFSFVLENSRYVPDTVTVAKGDTVIFDIDNRDNENHGLHLPEFGVSQAITPLQKTRVVFVASSAGAKVATCAGGPVHPEKINVIVQEA